MDSLATRLFEEIARLKTGGPTAKEVANTKTALLRDYETNMRRNAFLLTQFGQRYELGESPEVCCKCRSNKSGLIRGHSGGREDHARYESICEGDAGAGEVTVLSARVLGA